MKDNLASKNIYNRKIIIELRFDPIPKFLDLRGTLIGKIDELKIMSTSHWGLGDSALKVTDSNDANEERIIINMEINRLSFVSTKIDSINDFINKFHKIYDVVHGCLGEISVTRIGCRIQGTYRTKSTDFDSILKSFKESFPTNIYVNDFPLQDLRLQIVYQNGMYHIGPVSENDAFLNTQFLFSERNNTPGIGIDTDNYLLKTTTDDLNDFNKVEDVFRASLSVEKDLVEKTGAF